MRVTEEAETCHYGCARTASSAASWAWQFRPDREGMRRRREWWRGQGLAAGTGKSRLHPVRNQGSSEERKGKPGQLEEQRRQGFAWD